MIDPNDVQVRLAAIEDTLTKLKRPKLITGREIEPGSITMDSTNYRFTRGVVLATFGAGSLATSAAFKHELGSQPSEVFAQAQTVVQGAVVATHTVIVDPETLTVQAQYVDGFAPGAGAVIPVAWIAFA